MIKGVEYFKQDRGKVIGHLSFETGGAARSRAGLPCPGIYP